MKKILVKLKKQVDDTYSIKIGTNLNLAQEIKSLKLNNHYAIITDDKVYKLYNAKIKTDFDKANLNYQFIVFKQGEKSKNLKTFFSLSEKMLKLHFDRKSVIIAFGGGVVGDMAGYVAGTFMRGIPFIQIPTTLLSQVDSSIGGKVAVDLKHGKNSSGLFYQPKKVIIDTKFLDTLNDEEFANGMFEIIKHAIIRNKSYFYFLKNNEQKIKQRQHKILTEMIYESCKIKADIVIKDEKENNLRRILNFGHTYGHAIETVSHYRIKHGFAVGAGMIKSIKLAYFLNKLKTLEMKDMITVIKNWGANEYNFSGRKFFNIISHDKKNIRQGQNLDLQVPIVLPVRIGAVVIQNFSIEELKKSLSLE